MKGILNVLSDKFTYNPKYILYWFSNLNKDYQYKLIIDYLDKISKTYDPFTIYETYISGNLHDVLNLNLDNKNYKNVITILKLYLLIQEKYKELFNILIAFDALSIEYEFRY